MNEDNDARVWEGLRAHLDNLAQLAPSHDIAVIRERSERQDRARGLLPLASSAILVVFAVIVAGRAGVRPLAAPSSVSPAAAGAVVTIDAGLQPRMAVDEVERLVLMRIHAMEAMAGTIVQPPAILAVTATTAAGVASLEPGAGQGTPASGVQWLVRAEGTFTSNRPRGTSPLEATGFFIIDDATGSVIGFGLP